LALENDATVHMIVTINHMNIWTKSSHFLHDVSKSVGCIEGLVRDSAYDWVTKICTDAFRPVPNKYPEGMLGGDNENVSLLNFKVEYSRMRNRSSNHYTTMLGSNSSVPADSLNYNLRIQN
jgi:hypothetical protein